MLRKILRKFQPNFQHYVKKIEAKAKNGFLIKKKRVMEKKILSLKQIIKMSTFQQGKSRKHI